MGNFCLFVCNKCIVFSPLLSKIYLCKRVCDGDGDGERKIECDQRFWHCMHLYLNIKQNKATKQANGIVHR